MRRLTVYFGDFKARDSSTKEISKPIPSTARLIRSRLAEVRSHIPFDSRRNREYMASMAGATASAILMIFETGICTLSFQRMAHRSLKNSITLLPGLIPPLSARKPLKQSTDRIVSKAL